MWNSATALSDRLSPSLHREASGCNRSRRMSMRKLQITADLIPEAEGGFSVYCPELDIYTQGETEEECLANLKEAAEMHLEELGNLACVREVLRRQIEVEANA
jgi:predicted RNase H-like HicB family nuclease